MGCLVNLYVLDCYVDSLGHPVFHAHAKTYYGSWMRDASPRKASDSTKRWATHHFYGNTLYEYADEADLRRERVREHYILPYVFDGTNHVFHDGSFYFHRAGTPKIGKYEVATGDYIEQEIPNAAHKYDHYLYNLSYSYFDLAIDENEALWLLYHYWHEPYLVVSRLDLKNLTIMETWNLTWLNHTELGNGFVICGTLYLLRSAYELQSEIVYAYDLFRNTTKNTSIPWANLYHNSNMVSYNRADKRIYVVDHGYLLTVPVRLKYRGGGGVS